MVALAAIILWGILNHVRRARTAARAGGISDPFAYQWIALALLLSLGYMLWFLWHSGCRAIVAGMILSGVFVYHLIYMRLRAENGMSFMGLPITVDRLLFEPFGSAFYRPSEVVAVNAARWTYFQGWGEGVDATFGSTFDSYKIAESSDIPQRRLTFALIFGFLFSLAVGIPIILSTMYTHGFMNTHQIEGNWLQPAVQNLGSQVFTTIDNPTGADPAAFLGLGAGATVTLALNAMRLRFWWWPFHPVGYLVANAWGTQWWYMPFFVGWLLKTLVVRYGGLRLYQRTVLVAIGVIVGDKLVYNLWPLIMWTVGESGW
jgi:hypothetical protein